MKYLDLYIVFLLAFILQSSCYYLSVNKDLLRGSKIFEFSEDFQEPDVKYNVVINNEHNCSKVPFYLDKQNGVLYYKPIYVLFVTKDICNVFKFNISIVHKQYSLTVPLEVELLSNSQFKLIKAFSNSNFKHKKSVLQHHMSVESDVVGANKVYAAQYNLDCPNALLPKTICFCNPSNFTKSFFSSHFELKQLISSCYLDGIFIPEQEVVVSVLFDKLYHSKKLLRKKRATQNQLHFEKIKYECHVSENKPNNTFVCSIRAYNQNGQIAQGVQYGLEAVENRDSSNLFKIGSNGRIVTNSYLDREKMHRHAFRVTANRHNAYQIHTLLDIIIDDENDNKPVFLLPDYYKIRIDENLHVTSPILEISAYDKDGGVNGDITYKISTVNPRSDSISFAIDEDGNLYVNGSVDHEVYDQYNLTIVAQDQGIPVRESSLHITVDIADKNDNFPEFSKSVYVVNVNENVPIGSVIESVSAEDRDAGDNGRVTYGLIDGNQMNKFRINEENGRVILKKKLDFEEGDSEFVLTIRASDGGRPPKTNTTKLKINVIDVNDNSPQFYSSSYRFSVFENARINFVVGQVQAFDRDDGVNSKITYSIVHKSSSTRGVFSINRNTGDITVASSLDYETTKSYTFSVRATDGGIGSGRFVQTEVHISVKDVNDNAPQFTLSQYKERIPEDTSISSDIIQIQAIDPDKQTTLGISYAITRGDPHKKFSIATRNNIGIVKLNKRLDYKKQKLYRLTVTASDGSHSNSTVVLINIMDTNSHQPIFDRSTYSASIKENVPIGTNVLQVHASDDDVGENANVSYCFTSVVRSFDINSTTGVITTKRLLDFETNSVIILNVKAQDNGQPRKHSITEVDIYLQDTNDNAPRFDQSSYSGSISEDSPLFTKVLRIHATDKDSNRNSKILYSLTDGEDGNGHFSIDQYTGIIRTAQFLDRETVSRYNLVAYAVDGGDPAQSTAVSITVNVLDVDDNAPQFLNIKNNMLIFHVPENVSMLSEIAHIQAVDPDEQPDAEIIYELDNDPLIRRKWHLNSKTGILKNLIKFDYEKQKRYELFITASSSNLVKQARLVILIDDCNDNVPVLNDFEIVFNNYRSLSKHSFPYGVIGRVPAYDPDVSDHLTYKFLSGNEGNLLKLNKSTGSLQLNPSLDSNRQFTAPMMIQVSDGEHDAQASCVLKVVGISDTMLQHSITVRVLHMNAYTFLAPSIMKRFSDGLSKILNTSSNNVFVFNVQNDTDVILNVSFSAKNTFNSFFTSKFLQDQVYLNRQTLVNLTGYNVLPFDDNICLREPCLNYKRCTSVLTFNSSAPFISSPTMIFRPIHPVYKLKCECPIGFTNDETCADEVDLCYSNPCMNGATCVALEGSYLCLCPSRHTGRNCEINLDDSQCSDHPNLCENGGTCSVRGSSLRCDCSAFTRLTSIDQSDLSVTCKLLSRRFSRGDFLMLPGISNQWHFTLSLSFSTVEMNGLLLYNGRLNHQHDFIALEIVRGQVQLNFSTGSSWTLVDPYVAGGVNDGKWHTVEIKYYNEPTTLPLPHGVLNRLGPSSTKVVTLTVDPASCDDVVASKWNPSRGNYSCSVKRKQTSSKKSLDLTSPLLLGGVPDLPEVYQVHSMTYSGCLANLQIDGRKIDFAKFVANNGSSPGCAPMRTQCTSQKCGSHGSCSERWNGFKCDCNNGYTGQRCEHLNNFIVQLSGTGCLQYRTTKIPFFRLPWHHRLSFRTFDSSAVLIYFVLDQSELFKITLKINDGYLWYDVKQSLQVSRTARVSEVRVDDGRWHDVTVDWKPLSSSTNVSLTVDEQYSSYLRLPSGLNQMRVKSCYIGGMKIGGARTQSSFTGCIQNVQVSTPQQVYRYTTSMLQRVDGGSYDKGCRGDGCRGVNCPTNSECVEDWTRHSCKCHKGYVGDSCISACTLPICENRATCRHNLTDPYGYSCKCTSGYQGRTCQRQVTESCPPGWFGLKICAPCQCSSELNFNQACHTKTGKCSCKINHYYNSTTRSCLPCDCYPIGSEKLQCQDETGQCQCRKTVIGKQCNRCASESAEVTDTGCRVLYEKKCPRSYYEGLVWQRTSFNDRYLQQCPRGSTGVAFRYCGEEKDLWKEPNFSNCTSDAFIGLSKQLNDVTKNKALLETKSIPLSFNLLDLTQHHDPMYENDVIVTCRMVEGLLNYESTLSGFNLAASVEQSYTANLVEATSSLFDNKSLPYWLAMEESGKTSPATLIRSWESYMRTMLSNLQLIRCNDSYFRSPNIDVSMTLLSLDQRKRKDYTYRDSSDDVSLVDIKLPSSSFKYFPSSSNSSRTGNPAVGVIVYRNLHSVMPLIFADDRTFRRPEKPSLNSVVVSVQLHNNRSASTESSHQLSDPVRISFRLLNPNVIEPRCMFWNFSARSSEGNSGGWSQSGCKAKLDGDHVTCECYHLTSFAVITDEEAIRPASASLIVVIIGTSLAIMLLIATITASLVLKVTSVRMTITQNLASALLLIDVIYIAVNQPIRNIYLCMTIAICFQFALLSVFAWLLCDGLHLYRKLTEPRDVDRGKTRFYFIVGWIVPFIITALSVGLDARGYGNSSFCWISMSNLLIWSVLGPVIMCSVGFLLLLLMSIHAFLASKINDVKRKELSRDMRTSFFIAISIMLGSLFATLAVNLHSKSYFYLYTLLSLAQAILIFTFNCFLNKEVRAAYEKYKRRRAKRADLNTTRQHLLQQSFGMTPVSSSGPMMRVNCSTSGSLYKTGKASSPMPGFGSDSDASMSSGSSSNSSLSIGSSSEDEQVEMNTYHNIVSTRPGYQPRHPRSTEKRGNGRLPSNGDFRKGELSVKKKLVVRISSGSGSDGSNETAV